MGGAGAILFAFTNCYPTCQEIIMGDDALICAARAANCQENKKKMLETIIILV
jgi:hypothetical protein